MGTLHIEGVVSIASLLSRDVAKRLKYNDSSQRLAIVEHTAKLLIFVAVLVRDQEVGGSNPLAPTSFSH
jgi:hypothetical protein